MGILVEDYGDKTKDFNQIINNMKANNETKYIVWVGGIDDHYTNLLDAESAIGKWKSKGYNDVQLETIK